MPTVESQQRPARGIGIRSDQLHLLMAARGWDQQGLARESGVSRATVNYALNGRPILPSTLARIVTALARVPELYLAVRLLEGDVTDPERNAGTDPQSAPAVEDRSASSSPMVKGIPAPRVWADRYGDHLRLLIVAGPVDEFRLDLDPRAGDLSAIADWLTRAHGGDQARVLEALVAAVAPGLTAVRRKAA